MFSTFVCACMGDCVCLPETFPTGLPSVCGWLCQHIFSASVFTVPFISYLSTQYIQSVCIFFAAAINKWCLSTYILQLFIL